MSFRRFLRFSFDGVAAGSLRHRLLQRVIQEVFRCSVTTTVTTKAPAGSWTADYPCLPCPTPALEAQAPAAPRCADGGDSSVSGNDGHYLLDGNPVSAAVYWGIADNMTAEEASGVVERIRFVAPEDTFVRELVVALAREVCHV